MKRFASILDLGYEIFKNSRARERKEAKAINRFFRSKAKVISSKKIRDYTSNKIAR